MLHSEETSGFAILMAVRACDFGLQKRRSDLAPISFKEIGPEIV